MNNKEQDSNNFVSKNYNNLNKPSVISIPVQHFNSSSNESHDPSLKYINNNLSFGFENQALNENRNNFFESHPETHRYHPTDFSRLEFNGPTSLFNETLRNDSSLENQEFFNESSKIPIIYSNYKGNRTTGLNRIPIKVESKYIYI